MARLPSSNLSRCHRRFARSPQKIGLWGRGANFLGKFAPPPLQLFWSFVSIEYFFGKIKCLSHIGGKWACWIRRPFLVLLASRLFLVLMDGCFVYHNHVYTHVYSYWLFIIVLYARDLLIASNWERTGQNSRVQLGVFPIAIYIWPYQYQTFLPHLLLVIFVGHTHRDKGLVNYCNHCIHCLCRTICCHWLVKFMLEMTFNISKTTWCCLYTSVLVFEWYKATKLIHLQCIARAQITEREAAKFPRKYGPGSTIFPKNSPPPKLSIDLMHCQHFLFTNLLQEISTACSRSRRNVKLQQLDEDNRQVWCLM